MDLIGSHRQKNLPLAPQLAETREDQTNRFLKPQIGIKTEAQFAAPRLGAGRIKHSGA